MDTVYSEGVKQLTKSGRNYLIPFHHYKNLQNKRIRKVYCNSISSQYSRNYINGILDSTRLQD